MGIPCTLMLSPPLVPLSVILRFSIHQVRFCLYTLGIMHFDNPRSAGGALPGVPPSDANSDEGANGNIQSGLSAILTTTHTDPKGPENISRCSKFSLWVGQMRARQLFFSGFVLPQSSLKSSMGMEKRCVTAWPA